MHEIMTVMTMLLTLVAGLAAADDPPLRCALAPKEHAQRAEEIRELFQNCEDDRELQDGYAFRFPGDPDYARRLMDLIHAERQCCSFLTFELLFEPDHGPIWLRVRGSEEVKSFLRGLMSQE